MNAGWLLRPHLGKKRRESTRGGDSLDPPSLANLSAINVSLNEESSVSLPESSSSTLPSDGLSRAGLIVDASFLRRRFLPPWITESSPRVKAAIAVSFVTLLGSIVLLAVAAANTAKNPNKSSSSGGEDSNSFPEKGSGYGYSSVPTKSPFYSQHPTQTIPVVATGAPSIMPEFGRSEDAAPTENPSSQMKNPSPQPTDKPSKYPTHTEAPSGAPLDCTNKEGLHMNHLGNERPCSWMDSAEKRMRNCGTPEFPRSQLGDACPESCEMYYTCRMGHGFDQNTVSSQPTATPSTISTHSVPPSEAPSYCLDQDGSYTNHLGNKRPCSWMNDLRKKTKNCGTQQYPRTELGESCPESCDQFYACPDGAFSSVSTAKPSSLPTTHDICIDNDGIYINHQGDAEPCSWLDNTHRREMNCGTPGSPRTVLGQVCPMACKDYYACPPNKEFGPCEDRPGMFENQAGKAVTCSWLKYQDRQYWNCGSGGYTMTELGQNCGYSCRTLNGCQ